MTLTEAREIYAYPEGHSREELKACLYALNEAAQPVELDNLQFAVIVDATQRLKLLEGKKVSEEGSS